MGVVALLALVAAVPARAQEPGSIRIDLPADDPFPAAPEIFVRAILFPDSTAPRRVRLRLALDAAFGLVVYDSTIVGDEPRFTMTKLLPENRDIFIEAFVLDKNGREIGSARVPSPRRTGPRLTLVSPTALTLLTRRPQFSWRSAPVTITPGPWVYELFITNVGLQLTRSIIGITDTVFTLPDSLEANTSYRWKVIARLPNGLPSDSAVASSKSSFVIAPSDAPVTTLLYQNFPNPFPAPSSATTCIWFDLQMPSRVELTIHDLRGHRVRALIPGQLPSDLPSGRYGRRFELDASGCDPRLSWDGTADDGRVVPAGVYLVRLHTDTAPQAVKKIVFLGR